MNTWRVFRFGERLTIFNCISFLSYTRRKNDYTPRVITDRLFITFMTRLARFRNNDPLLLPSNNERQICNAIASHFTFFTTPKRNKIVLYLQFATMLYTYLKIIIRLYSITKVFIKKNITTAVISYYIEL